ncbi:hypothetical protein [Geobacter sp. SVR]|uniref:hypothetical protein n=1 Tax=Geobacter sp. SVR TaxID=2495594 RepID=UPI00143EFC55|nr:hypothetical protein [Geobacter sp. SVR]BCS52526.1 hypothetical protein GSVR_08340 [Geobacter sp. SVR]GCF84037.1 hypothetical protein GSbR_06370 [Geobacter sp. SVR]
MFKRMAIAMILTIFLLSMSGCLYRGDGIFKQIGDSDYKAQLNFMNLFVAANSNPTYVYGAVISEDRITPVKFATVVLRKKEQQEIVTRTNSDNAGRFLMSGILSDDDYNIEIDSPEYVACKTVRIEPNRRNYHEIFVRKK